jgi:hypothetical protein
MKNIENKLARAFFWCALASIINEEPANQVDFDDHSKR